MKRLEERHPRAFITTFLVGALAIFVFGSLDAERSGEISLGALAALWGFGLLVAIGHQLLLSRRGRLIIRDPAERERKQRSGQEFFGGGGWMLIAGGGIGFAAIVGAFSAPVVPAILSVVAGAWLGFTPILLWIAWVIRPDQKKGEWL